MPARRAECFSAMTAAGQISMTVGTIIGCLR